MWTKKTKAEAGNPSSDGKQPSKEDSRG